MNTSSDFELTGTLQPLVVRLLTEHAYGVCELAQACAQKLHQPLCEVITPLTDSLEALVSSGQVRYDRQQNRVALA
ncbi:MAG TPA: hypothetical protein IGR64_04850 [Leptolyngbyaceae cyanobacterium M65_K2018_010]|nr:hypothetical protein [Leptolyngbyaceae cyanobacterium M65_K2018_010]